MKIIVCLDDKGGMLFNSRRQSRDRAVVTDILESLDGEKLYINEYSKILFSAHEGAYSVVDDIFGEPLNGVRFVENVDPKPYLNKVSKITVYRWNRVYPGDLRFDADLTAEGFSLTSSRDFEGYSHEKITKEVFER